jgi:PBP1b-binding outer membrane lipoprotein LpoB
LHPGAKLTNKIGIMKVVFVLIVAVALLLNGCAAIKDAKFVTEEGKKPPFVPHKNPYEAPQDPTTR